LGIKPVHCHRYGHFVVRPRKITDRDQAIVHFKIVSQLIANDAPTTIDNLHDITDLICRRPVHLASERPNIACGVVDIHALDGFEAESVNRSDLDGVGPR